MDENTASRIQELAGNLVSFRSTTGQKITKSMADAMWAIGKLSDGELEAWLGHVAGGKIDFLNKMDQRMHGSAHRLGGVFVGAEFSMSLQVGEWMLLNLLLQEARDRIIKGMCKGASC